jgi:oligoendopeptidase F
MGLYPYTYSAGLTISTQVSKRILKEGQPAVDDWIEVLKAGGTKTPVELSQMAGVDITTEQPLLDTIAYIGELVDELVKLTDELKVK